MKSITKKISLLLMLSAVLFLSSCLDSGSNSYIGNQEYSYITRSETTGIVYARTIAGYLITSPQISILTPETAAFITYQVTEETEKVEIENGLVVYKVNLGGEPKSIDQSMLQLATAPDVPAVNFESLREPLFAETRIFGDLWLFPYTFKVKKGQNVRVDFFTVEQEPSDIKLDEVLIDVRLVKTGTPQEGATETIEADYVVVNMSTLRIMMADKADSNGDLKIRFRYYREDYKEGLYTSNKAYSIKIDKK